MKNGQQGRFAAKLQSNLFPGTNALAPRQLQLCLSYHYPHHCMCYRCLHRSCPCHHCPGIHICALSLPQLIFVVALFFIRAAIVHIPVIHVAVIHTTISFGLIICCGAVSHVVASCPTSVPYVARVIIIQATIICRIVVLTIVPA